jgi:ligand-binding sensor domain-containing protein
MQGIVLQTIFIFCWAYTLGFNAVADTTSLEGGGSDENNLFEPVHQKIHVKWIETPPDKLRESIISSLGSDEEVLWVGTWSEGLLAFNTSRNKCYRINFEDEWNPILSLFADKEGCWFGLGDGRIGRIRWEQSDGDFYEIGPRDAHSWFESIVWGGGAFWFASSEEIVTYHPTDGVWRRIRKNGLPLTPFDQWRTFIVMSCIRPDFSQESNTLLQETVQKELAEGKTVRAILGEQMLSRGLGSIFHHRDFTLRTLRETVALVRGDGVIFLSPAGSEVEEALRRENMGDVRGGFTDIAVVGGKIAISTAGDGLVVYDEKEKKYHHVKRGRATSLWETFNRGWGPWSEEDYIVSMEPHDDALWLVTIYGRVLKYNVINQSPLLKLPTLPTLSLEVFLRVYPGQCGQITSLAYHAGALWIGTSEGLMRLDHSQHELAACQFEKGQWLKYAPGDTIPPLATPAEKTIYATICEYMGAPYLRGGESLKGVDCSGFVLSVFKRLGIALPHKAAFQHDSNLGAHTIDELRLGDLVFFYEKDSPIYHAGVYLGEGHFAHSFGGMNGVTISSLADSYFPLTGVKRLPFNSPHDGKANPTMVAALLKARPDSVVTSNFPFQLQKESGEGGDCSITVTLDANSELSNNGRVMLVMLSGKAFDQSLRETIQGEIVRSDVLIDPGALINVGFQGELFASYQSGIVMLLKTTPPTTGTEHRKTTQFRFQPTDTESYFLVKLRGTEAGTLYKIF